MLRLFGPDCAPDPLDASTVKELPSGYFWMDLLNPTVEEERLAEKALGQNIPTREEMAEIEPSSRLYERHGALFMTASVVHGVTDGKPDTDPVSFILTDKLLVTVRYVDPKPFVAFFSHLCSEPEIAPDPLSVLVRLLDTIIDRLADELEATARDSESVSDLVFEQRPRGTARKNRPENRLEAILLRIGGIQRLLAEIRESALSTSRMVSFLATSKLCTDSEHHAPYRKPAERRARPARS